MLWLHFHNIRLYTNIFNKTHDLILKIIPILYIFKYETAVKNLDQTSSALMIYGISEWTVSCHDVVSYSVIIYCTADRLQGQQHTTIHLHIDFVEILPSSFSVTCKESSATAVGKAHLSWSIVSESVSLSDNCSRQVHNTTFQSTVLKWKWFNFGCILYFQFTFSQKKNILKIGGKWFEQNYIYFIV